MLDLLLFNSFMGRPYGPSDVLLDNGLGLLCRAARDAGLRVALEDPTSLERFEEFSPRGLALFADLAVRLLLRSLGRGRRPRLAALPWAVASCLQRRGVERRLRRYLEGLARRIAAEQVAVVGVKCWLGRRFVAAEELAALVHRLSPRTLVVVGGPQVNVFRELSLQGNEFDFGIYGEGERALVRLVLRVRQLLEQGMDRAQVVEVISREAAAGGFPNLLYRRDGRPQAAPRELLPVERDFLPLYPRLSGKAKVHVLVDARGCCWGRCHFCVHSRIAGPYAERSPRSVVEEMREVVQRYRIGIFRFAASSPSLEHQLAVARAIREARLQVVYSCFGRGLREARRRHGELVRAFGEMVDAGLRAIFIGAEAADPRVMRFAMNKGLEPEDVVHTVRAIREAAAERGQAVDVGLSFIYPCPLPPGVDLEGLRRENLRMIREADPDTVLITPAGAFPGTPWYEEAERFGFELGHDYAQRLLRYQYELGKHPRLWPRASVRLQGMDLPQMLELAAHMGDEVRRMGYPVDLTDENCLLARLAGFTGRKGLHDYQRLVTRCMLSMRYGPWREVIRRVNRRSEELARQSLDGR